MLDMAFVSWCWAAPRPLMWHLPNRRPRGSGDSCGAGQPSAACLRCRARFVLSDGGQVGAVIRLLAFQRLEYTPGSEWLVMTQFRR